MSHPGEIAGLSDSSVDMGDVNDERGAGTEHLCQLNMVTTLDNASVCKATLFFFSILIYLSLSPFLSLFRVCP